MTADRRSPLRELATLTDRDLTAAIARLPADQLAGMLTAAHLRAHGGQVAPAGDWTTWLILAGRGFGKTFAGAAWVDERARRVPGARIALVGATLNEARSVMVEGDAGVLAVAPERPRFEPSKRQLTWTNGSTATLFGAAEPDSLRGPSFAFAWGDEIAKWDAPQAGAGQSGDGAADRRPPSQCPDDDAAAAAVAAGARRAGGRRGGDARADRSTTASNLPAAYLETMLRDYGATRLGRQELHGEFVADLDGALWTRTLLDRGRVAAAPAHGRTVVGVDPPAGAGGKADACGIVVVRLGPDGRGYVVADRSVQGLSPEGWARVVAAAADEFSADRIVAEVNNGGAMVASVLRAVDTDLAVKSVHAAAGKVARAEPVAALYEAGRVVHAGMFAALEDELCGLLTGGTYAGPGRSPDRADALVWALTELLLGKAAVPRVRMM